jgi:uncharacterized protein YegJ (DUF2314 family)
MNGNLRKFSFAGLFGVSTIASWTPNALAANVVGQQLKNADAEPAYFQVPKDRHHADMRRAVVEARKTVQKFIIALQHPTSGQQDFEIKKPFTHGDEVEHIWLSDVKLVGNNFQGRVDNQPRKIPDLKLGQVVSVNPKEISDWLYIDNGKLVGGYTVRVHYNELTAEQKRDFDRQADFKIEKQ